MKNIIQWPVIRAACQAKPRPLQEGTELHLNATAIYYPGKTPDEEQQELDKKNLLPLTLSDLLYTAAFNNAVKEFIEEDGANLTDKNLAEHYMAYFLHACASGSITETKTLYHIYEALAVATYRVDDTVTILDMIHNTAVILHADLKSLSFYEHKVEMLTDSFSADKLWYVLQDLMFMLSKYSSARVFSLDKNGRLFFAPQAYAEEFNRKKEKEAEEQYQEFKHKYQEYEQKLAESVPGDLDDIDAAIGEQDRKQRTETGDQKQRADIFYTLETETQQKNRNKGKSIETRTDRPVTRTEENAQRFTADKLSKYYEEPSAGSFGYNLKPITKKMKRMLETSESADHCDVQEEDGDLTVFIPANWPQSFAQLQATDVTLDDFEAQFSHAIGGDPK